MRRHSAGDGPVRPVSSRIFAMSPRLARPIQGARVNLPVICHTAVSAKRVPIFFVAKGNQAAYSRWVKVLLSEQARRITAEAMQIPTEQACR